MLNHQSYKYILFYHVEDIAMFMPVLLLCSIEISWRKCLFRQYVFFLSSYENTQLDSKIPEDQDSNVNEYLLDIHILIIA
jgi:hypothetical protein